MCFPFASDGQNTGASAWNSWGLFEVYECWLLLCCCCCWVASVVSDPVWPHRRQPPRLPRPWDSPGRNTGVGCHFLLQCMKRKSESEVAQLCPTLHDPMDCSLPGSSVHGIPQAWILEWVAMSSSREIFPSQGSNPDHLLCRQSLLSKPPGKPVHYLYMCVYSCGL